MCKKQQRAETIFEELKTLKKDYQELWEKYDALFDPDEQLTPELDEELKSISECQEYIDEALSDIKWLVFAIEEERKARAKYHRSIKEANNE